MFRKDWPLGFLGFVGLRGIGGILEGNFTDSLWIAWFAWFAYFIPHKK